VRIALTLEYDGSAFCGWQTQTSACAIQDHLERALTQIAGQSIATICAGRTDAGVHALMQTVHFDSGVVRPESAWIRGVNALLPAGIAVRSARPVTEQFNARYSATGRRYVYALVSRPVRPALDALRVGWTHHSLNEDRMLRAAQALIGTHDFSAFRSAECQARSPVRELREIGISRNAELLLIEFAANAFLHHMVRNLVGSLIKVGSGHRPLEWLREVLDSRDRSQAAATIAPHGLYLAQVEYPSHFGIAPASNYLFTPLEAAWQPQ
jgi:tRNA pseudouridine38-40 synthase